MGWEIYYLSFQISSLTFDRPLVMFSKQRNNASWEAPSSITKGGFRFSDSRAGPLKMIIE